MPQTTFHPPHTPPRFTRNADVNTLQVLWIKTGNHSCFDSSERASFDGCFWHRAKCTCGPFYCAAFWEEKKKKSHRVYLACMCAFCSHGNAADAGSSWDHVAK